MTKKTKVIIFDYDGVLVDSLDVQFEIYRHLIKEMGTNKVELSGDSFTVDYREFLETLGINTPERIKEAEVRYLAHLQGLRHKIVPFDFMKSLIAKLSEDFFLAVASNNNELEIESVLTKHGLKDYFDFIIGPPTHSVLKPEPDQILACLDLARIDKSNALYIGDMKGDLVAAQNAGITSVGVAWGFHSKAKLESANFIVDTPEELIDLVSDPKTFKERQRELQDE